MAAGVHRQAAVSALLLAVLALGLWPGCAGSKRRALETPVLRDVQYELQAWPFGRNEGRQIITEHYDVFTTVVDPGLLKAIPQALETAYGYYARLVPTTQKPAERMPVYLLARRGEWEQVTRQRFPGRAPLLLRIRNGGYTENGVAVIQYVAHSTTFPILAHEGFHQYLHHHAGRAIPPWLHEGLASYCEGQRWGAGGLEAFAPWQNALRRNALAETLLRNELIPLTELLRISAGNVVGGSTRRISAYYAQLWVLMLFLEEGADGKYTAAFDRLRGDVGSQDLSLIAQAAHVSSTQPTFDFGTALFTAYFGDDLEALEAEYVRFMRERILGEKP